MWRQDDFGGLVGALVWAVPFGWVWNQLAPVYLPQLPALYRHLPFWHCEGLFLLAAILRLVLLPAPGWRGPWPGWRPARKD